MIFRCPKLECCGSIVLCGSRNSSGRKGENRNIATTDSTQELAQFWDTHDVTDFEYELEEVTEQVFERGTVIALDLESAEAEAVKKLVQSKGV